MSQPPSGTVTFLFTDLERSTRLWEEQPDEMRVALAEHDAMVRSAIERHAGYVFSTGGDGFAAAFGRAADAIGAAEKAQSALAGMELIKVRMGINTGEVDERDGDYFGPAVNRTARLMSVAHGGQIVLSAATAGLVRDLLPEDATLVDLGEHRLRDLSQPERVFQLQAPGRRSEFAPLRSLEAFPGNLPLQVSSFIGRDRELKRVADALAEARVVTLTGVGGVGKTRLALQVAADVLPRFREGAWLVELQAVRDPEAVPTAFATTFGVTARAGQTIEQAVAEFLRTKQLLLVVDNCEHLLEPVADVVEMLERSCPDLVVLATSREGLALDGERVVPVPSLPAPPADSGLAEAARADAVRLFTERAASADPDFALTAENAAAVVQVCRRLDGVPLAIELAAARVTAMNPAELVRGLDRRLEMLSGGRRHAVQRHQTLRATIDWSYELLSEPERRLLARLAVFAGGCTRAAAETVCGGARTDPTAVFELLAGLVARSLVVAERDHPETRYRLLETIREYGEERLAEYGETDDLRARHAEFFVEFGHGVLADIQGPLQLVAARRFRAEHENLLAAMNHAIDTDNVDLALRLAKTRPTGGYQIGYEALPPIDAILGLTGSDAHPMYSYGLAMAGQQAARRGEHELATTIADRALVFAQRHGDYGAEWWISVVRTNIAFSIGDLQGAARLQETTAEIARSIGNIAECSYALNGAATLYAMAGVPEHALRCASEGLALARAAQIPAATITNLAALAGALVDQDRPRAAALLRESLELRARVEYESAQDLTQAVFIGARLDDWALALGLASRAIPMLQWDDDRPLLGAVFNVVARAIVATDAPAAAVLQGAAKRLTPIPSPARASPQPANGATGRPPGDATFVTRWRRDTTGTLRETLTDDELRERRAEGEAMSTDEAVAFALDAIARATASEQVPQ